MPVWANQMAVCEVPLWPAVMRERKVHDSDHSERRKFWCHMTSVVLMSGLIVQSRAFPQRVSVLSHRGQACFRTEGKRAFAQRVRWSGGDGAPLG